MAQGYLKSVGIGKFTPKSDFYSKEQGHSKSDSSSSATKWKKLDDDQEFEFDI